MGNSGNNNRGRKGLLSEEEMAQRFTEALERAADRAPLGAPLDEAGLEKRRDLIAKIAQKGPRKPTFTKAADFIAEREAGVEPLDAIFPRDGGKGR